MIELAIEVGLTLMGLGLFGLTFIALYCLFIFAHEAMMTIRQAFREGRKTYETCDCRKQDN